MNSNNGQMVGIGLALFVCGLGLLVWAYNLNAKNTSPRAGLAATFAQAFGWILVAVWAFIYNGRRNRGHRS